MSFSSGRSSSNTQQEVWQEQRDFLERQFGRGEDLAERQLDDVRRTARRLSTQLGREVRQDANRFGSAYREADRIGGQADYFVRGKDPMGRFMRGRMGRDNPYLQGQIDAFGDDINRQVGRELGQVRADAGFMGEGAIGGAREALERGLVREAGLREFSQGANQLRFGDYTRQGEEALALQGQQMDALGLGLDAQRNQLAFGQARAALRNERQNLGLWRYNAQFAPLQQQAAILGRPTVLTSGASSSRQFGFSF